MYYVVSFEILYDSLEDVVARAPQDLAAHVARSRELHASGSVLMAGAFVQEGDEPLSTMAICPTREAAEAFARGDPFLLHGMVRSWRIREWRDMFAD